MSGAKTLTIQIAMNLRSSFLPAVIIALLLIACFGFPAAMQRQSETEGALQFTKDLSSGEIFSKVQAPWYSVIGAPGYPGMLALSQTLLGKKLLAVWGLHLALTLLVFWVAIVRFKKFVPVWIIVLLTAFAFWLWRDFCLVIGAEWSVLCILLLFFCLTPQSYQECSPRRIFSLGLLLSLLILVRPALFACLFVVIIFIAVVIRPSERRKASVGILLGLLPVFFWCTFNSYRLGNFAVSVSAGHSLFGVASLLGFAEFKNEGWPELERFSEYVNTLKVPKAGEEGDLVSGLFSNYSGLVNRYNYNVYQVALQFDKERDYPRQFYDDLMFRYAKRVLLENPVAYIKFIICGLSSFLRDSWLFIISAILLVMLVRSGHALSLALGAALATHFFHVLLCSSMQIVGSTCYLLTLIPLGLLTVLSMLAVTGVRRSTYPSSK